MYSGNAPSTIQQPNGGTKIGTLDLRVPYSTESIGNIFYTNMGGINGFILFAQAGGSTGFQGSSLFNYTSSLCFTFEAMIPIV